MCDQGCITAPLSLMGDDTRCLFRASLPFVFLLSTLAGELKRLSLAVMAASDGVCLHIGASGLICKYMALRRLQGGIVHC